MTARNSSDNPVVRNASPLESWRPVVGYEGNYWISDCGRIRNSGDKIVRPYLNSHGYWTVKLCFGGVKRKHLVHGLVMTAFVGPYPERKVVNHIDGNPRNNHLANLEYITHRENIQHASRMGRMRSGESHWTHANPERLHRGERNPRAKLTSDQVREIRRLAEGGEANRTLALQFGVSNAAIRLIVQRINWAHIQ